MINNFSFTTEYSKLNEQMERSFMQKFSYTADCLNLSASTINGEDDDE